MRGRFRQRSLKEVADRMRQAGSALTERLAPPASGGRHRALRAEEPLLPFAPSAEETIQFIQARWPEHARSVIAAADDAIAGRVSLLGYGPLDVGHTVDWHRDMISGRQAPRQHWSRIRYLESEQVGDHKVTWELNRHHVVVTLAQAWTLTGDDRYARRAADLLSSWLEDNPPAVGINWASSLELALRIVSWTWALHLLRGATQPDEVLRQRIAASVALQAAHVRRHLSTWFSPNTHLTGEALGLLYAGSAFPSLPGASDWRTAGWSILCREATRQIRPDGTYFEQATWYQGYTVDFYLHALLLAATAGVTIPPEVWSRIDSAAKVLVSLLRPDGTLPLIGDDDGGRLSGFDVFSLGDFRGTAALATVLLRWPDRLARLGTVPPGLAWTLGDAAVEHLGRLPVAAPPPSCLFADGGLCIQRGTNGSAMVIDAGPHGALTGAHAHADALALDLTVSGRPVFIDAGAGAYVGPMRERFRRTDAHNTLTVDGRSSCEPGGAFGWSTRTDSSVEAWTTTARFDYLRASHAGYGDHDEPLTHTRRVLRISGTRWLVLDELSASRRHTVETRLLLAPDLIAEPVCGAVRIRDRASSAPIVHVLTEPEAEVDIVPALMAALYGAAMDTVALVQRCGTNGPSAMLTVITASEPDGTVARVNDTAGALWALEGGAGHDREVFWAAPREWGFGDTVLRAPCAFVRIHDGIITEAILPEGGRIVRGGVLVASGDATHDGVVYTLIPSSLSR